MLCSCLTGYSKLPLNVQDAVAAAGVCMKEHLEKCKKAVKGEGDSSDIDKAILDKAISQCREKERQASALSTSLGAFD